MFSIPRSMPPAPDDELTTIDFRYLGFLIPCTRPHPRVVNIHSRFEVRKHSYLVDVQFPWPNFPLSSKAFRYAALALSTASACISDYDNPDLFSYLAKFYRYIKEAIDSSSHIEVIVASYAAMLCNFKMSEAFETTLTYFNGICQSYSQLLARRSGTILGPEICSTITPLLLGSLRTLELAYLGRDPCAVGDGI